MRKQRERPFAARRLIWQAAAVVFSVALSAAAVVGFAGSAWGDDDAGSSESPSVPEENLVNPQQLPDSSFIYDATISDLEKADSYLDGQTVQVTGEVVGDRINAELDSEHCWFVLEATDGTYAEVSVFAPSSLAELIDSYGRYNVRGTTLQVRGTFNLTCPEHEGLSDLHADHLSVVSQGRATPDEFDPSAFAPALGMVAVGALLMLVFSRLRESRR